MRPMLTVCERCGLREVRHELVRRGIIVMFCDECYWGEAQQPDIAEPGKEQPPQQA
jgi:hypothetical protein